MRNRIRKIVSHSSGIYDLCTALARAPKGLCGGLPTLPASPQINKKIRGSRGGERVPIR